VLRAGARRAFIVLFWLDCDGHARGWSRCPPWKPAGQKLASEGGMLKLRPASGRGLELPDGPIFHRSDRQLSHNVTWFNRETQAVGQRVQV
jgi:hypothetical protein